LYDAWFLNEFVAAKERIGFHIGEQIVNYFVGICFDRGWSINQRNHF
jgi:hypothetical protein